MKIISRWYTRISEEGTKKSFHLFLCKVYLEYLLCNLVFAIYIVLISLEI